METQYINKIELQGRIGTVRISSVNNGVAANFSLMTEEIVKIKDSSAVRECTWHNVAAFENDKISLEGLTRGASVHITGRIRNTRYTSMDGTERVFTEVIASSLKLLNNE